MARIDAFLKLGLAQGCSDIHLAVGVPPMLRLRGELTPIKFRELSDTELETYILEILTAKQKERLEGGHDLDFSYVGDEGGRFRVNVFRKVTGVGADPPRIVIVGAGFVIFYFLLIRPQQKKAKEHKQMVENLKAVDAKIAGVVLNDKSGRGFKYYGSYGYYGNKQYGGYYGETDHDKPRGVFVRGMMAVWQKLNS